jgi:Zn-dependent protease
MEGPYFVVGRFRGARVGVHFFVPIAGLIYWAFDRSVWGMLAVFALILVHEVGHAGLVWFFGAKVVTIDLLPMGGECTWEGEVTPLQRALIAWGGVLAQALVLLPALFWPTPSSWTGIVVLRALTVTNAWMIAFNLMPIAPLDGSKAWRAIPIWWRSRKRDAKRRREASVTSELARRNRLDAQGVPDEVRDTVSELLERARRDE